jgi:hypothetical protein
MILPIATEQDLISPTRKTYSGPLEVGDPEREREHPVEVGDALVPELLPGVNDDLGVGLRRDVMALFL